MRALRVVGLGEDGKIVICEDPARGERFQIPADERLRAAARGDITRLGQIAIELESQMRPREIQSRIRAGESVEQVATAAGVPENRIERFAYPVLLERSRTAELAQRAHPIREDGPDVQELGEVVAQAFAARGQDYATATWDSWKGEDGRWVVQLAWTAGRSHNRAHWAFHPGAHGGTVTSLDDHAVDLLDPNPNRQLRTVRPVTELAAQALQVERPDRVERPERPERVVQPVETPVEQSVERRQAVGDAVRRAAGEPEPRDEQDTEPADEPQVPHAPEPAYRPTASVSPAAPPRPAEPTPQPATGYQPERYQAEPRRPEPREPESRQPEPRQPQTREPEPRQPAAQDPEPRPADPRETATDRPETPQPAAHQPEPRQAETSEPASPPRQPADEPGEQVTEPPQPTAAEPAPADEPAQPAAPAQPDPAPEPAAAKEEPPKPAPRRGKSKKARPTVPSWEDVLLGTRSNR